MPLLPSSAKGPAAADNAGDCLRSAAGRREGLKKWLAMKVGPPYGQGGSDKKAARASNLSEAGSGRKAVHQQGPRGRQSMPVAPRLYRKPAGARSSSPWGAGVSPRGPRNSPRSPAPVQAPAPTPLASTERSSGEAAAEPGASVRSTDRRSRRRLPLRKRSLIYAIYCTAQPNSAAATPSAQQPTPPAPPAGPARAEGAGLVWRHDLEHYQLGPYDPHQLATINASSIYASCQSMTSTNDSEEPASSASGASSAAGVSPGKYSASQLMSDLSVRFMVVDVVNHLNALQRRASAASNKSSCMSTSSRSSFAEQQAVEEMAYRCSSRYAPRLSTIERGHDGRLLLRPSMSATSTRDTRSLDSSDPGDGRSPAQGSVEKAHLPAPRISPLCGAAHGAVDSLRIHASKLSTDTLAPPDRYRHYLGYDSSLFSLREASGTDLHANDTFAPPAGSPQFSIITPPESPEKSNQTTANTSLVTAVAAGDGMGAAPGSSDPEMASDDMGEPLIVLGKAAELPSRLPGCYYTPERSAADRSGASADGKRSDTGRGADTGAGPRDSGMSSCEAGRPAADEDSTCSVSPLAPPSMSQQPGREGLPEARAACSGGGSEQPADSPCGAGGAGPCTGDVAGTRLPALDHGHRMPATGTDTSLLFGGHYASIACTAASIYQHAPRQREAQEKSKSRKLTAALVKAAQLDGLRQLQRMIRSGGGRHPSGAQRGSSSSASSSSSSNSTGSSSAYDMERSRPKDGRPRQALAKQPSQKAFRFNELVAVYDTWNRDEYDRRGIPTTKLDAELIEQIKQELNDYKAHEMRVHERSRENTHFIVTGPGALNSPGDP